MPPKRPTRVDAVVEQLLDDIVAGRYAPGSMLPNEMELARQTGTSRLTVREAVTVLRAKRLVEVRQGAGTVVCPASDWSLLDSAVLLARVKHGGSGTAMSKAFLEARRVVEVAVAELAAARRTPAHLDLLTTALQRMESAHAVADVGAFVEGDILFHQAVLDAAGNVFLVALFHPLGEVLQVTRHQTSSHPEIREHAIMRHRAILAALQEGSLTLAKQAMADHMQQTSDDIDTYVGRPLMSTLP
ncbi:MAG: FadR/GntR family transcriptional regulator [Streptosporangiaceae bacterium]